ncbi:hypothetical protein GF343_04900 [Candidatus Woesearchaeota archaeon]|nr:hypothetical protein [Candidatus Woesearchaeota archaeon]
MKNPVDPEEIRKLSDKIKLQTDADLSILEFYVTPDEQKAMVNMGFVGEFYDCPFPCDRVKQPYISFEEYANTSNGREHVQCPLFGERCEKIEKENAHRAPPCGLLALKINYLLG